MSLAGYPQVRLRTKWRLFKASVKVGTAVLVLAYAHHLGETIKPPAEQVAKGHGHHAKAKAKAKARHHSPAPPPPPPPSRVSRADIPGNYLDLYQAAGRRYGVPWVVLAGIGKVETNHGRSRAPGVRSGVNAFGCCSGPMQFNIRNGPPTTWARYGAGGNVYDPRDAIPAAARMLAANSFNTWRGPDPCPGVLGSAAAHHAILRYNRACWYARQVLELARSYQAGGS